MNHYVNKCLDFVNNSNRPSTFYIQMPLLMAEEINITIYCDFRIARI